MKKAIILVLAAVLAVSCHREIMLPLQEPVTIPSLNARFIAGEGSHQVEVSLASGSAIAPAADAVLELTVNGIPAGEPCHVDAQGSTNIPASISPGDELLLSCSTSCGNCSSRVVVPEEATVTGAGVSYYSYEKGDLSISLGIDRPASGTGYYIIEAFAHDYAICENDGRVCRDSLHFLPGVRFLNADSLPEQGGTVDFTWGDNPLKALRFGHLPHDLGSSETVYKDGKWVSEKAFYSRTVTLIIKVLSVSLEDYWTIKSTMGGGEWMQLVPAFFSDLSLVSDYPQNVDGGIGFVAARAAVDAAIPFMQHSHYDYLTYSNVEDYVWLY